MTTSESQPHLVHPKYRPDLDGLRAIAVLSVVAFHAFPNLVRGGFVGVDVFFVISGFLISSIILASLDSGRFSFLEFYARRIRRIFPALALVLLSALCLGLFTMFADEYQRLGKHVLGGAGFFSNFVLWNESGYFDSAVETKPLLHLWSLGIEEQFYIIWPLLLWLSWRQRYHPLIMISLLVLMSFMLNITGVRKDIVATFYLPHTRFWELLVGAGLAWFALYGSSQFVPSGGGRFKTGLMVLASFNRRPGMSQFKSILGALLLLLALALTDKQRAFPGWWAVLPVLATALLISGGPTAWLNRTVLAQRALVGIGVISFPLYLWHWLLLSFTRVSQGGEISTAQAAMAVFVSFILSWLTYKLVEQPLRLGQSSRAKTFGLLLALGFLGGAGWFLANAGIQAYSPYQHQAAHYLSTMVRSAREPECFDLPNAYRRADTWHCTLGEGSATPTVFAYGDSHAFSMLPAFEMYANKYGQRVAFLATSGCPPLLGVQSWSDEERMGKHDCRETNERIFRYVQANGIKAVVLVARWTYYVGGLTRPDQLNFISDKKGSDHSRDVSRREFVNALQQTMLRYNAIGTRVYFVADNPQQKLTVRDAMKKATVLADAEINQYAASRNEHIADQQFVTKLLSGYSSSQVHAINFDDVLCDPNSCPIVSEGKSLYFDDDHLSVFGAGLLAPGLARALLEVKQ